MQFWRLFRSLIKLKWRFASPSKKNVLLYFRTGVEVITPYFSSSEFQVLDLRETEVNIPIAIKCLINRDLSAKNYARQFILAAKPKLILTFIDNFPAFYLLKNEFPDVEIWLIQNGIRSERGDLFGLLISSASDHSNRVDKMFVFGSAIGKKYRRYISGEVIVHGSFKNNLVSIQRPKVKTVAYISTYRPNQKRDFIVPESRPESPVKYEEIISRRERAILWLANYCVENQLLLTVIGKHEYPRQEEAYYRSLLTGYKFDFMDREFSTSSYAAVDQSEIVVFTSSTLGYESLARGKKTAALMLDAEIIGAEALRFGWPAELPDDGRFWTHQLDERRFQEIMDYLQSVDDHEWNQVRGETIKDIISFDPNNSEFSKAVNSLRQSWQ